MICQPIPSEVLHFEAKKFSAAKRSKIRGITCIAVANIMERSYQRSS